MIYNSCAFFCRSRFLFNYKSTFINFHRFRIWVIFGHPQSLCKIVCETKKDVSHRSPLSLSLSRPRHTPQLHFLFSFCKRKAGAMYHSILTQIMSFFQTEKNTSWHLFQSVYLYPHLSIHFIISQPFFHTFFSFFALYTNQIGSKLSAAATWTIFNDTHETNDLFFICILVYLICFHSLVITKKIPPL